MSCQCKSPSSHHFGWKTSFQLANRSRAFTGLSLLGGLLSSSCCVIQLLFNALHFGCAGFAVLAPWQTHFRTFTLVVLAHLLYRDGINRRSLLTVALTIALTFSQDVVRLHNLHTGVPTPAAPPAAQSAPPAGETAVPASFQVSVPAHNSPETSSSTRSKDSTNNASPSGPAHDTHDPDQDGTRRNPAGPSATSSSASSSSAPAPGADGPPAASAAGPVRGAQRLRPAEGSPAPDTSASPSAEARSSTGLGAGAGAAVHAGVYMRLQVEGVKCEGCAARLKSALLRQLAGRLQRCAVDFGSGQVLVWGTPGAPLTAAEVRGAIQFVDLSYRVTLVESQGV